MEEKKAELKGFKNILWDFDGVIMDSMSIRDEGFRVVLADHSRDEIEQLMIFHRENGGLSRYVKFRYFFEEIKGQSISDEEVQGYADRFSRVMLERLVDPALFFSDTLDFIEKNHSHHRMHVVSGSDQKELRFICKELGINKYFLSIHGSPTPKKQLVSDILEKNGYIQEETVLIGDSINDYDAAQDNGISFYGYNNQKLKKNTNNYIQSF